MRCKRLLVGGFVILFGMYGFVFSAGATEYTYIGLNNGLWTTSANWEPLPASYPFGALDSACIQGGVNVYLDRVIELHGLTVYGGNSLTFSTGHIYNLTGTDPTDPYVINNGAITLSPDNSYFQLNAGLTATFTGAGTLHMVTGSAINGAATALYINDSNHTIRGAGWIVANVENRGSIIADGPELHIHGGSNNYQVTQSATGVLTTAGPGSLLTMGDGFTLHGGHVNPNGGEVRMDNMNVWDGTIFGPGTIVIGSYGPSGVQTLFNFTTAADITITNGATLEIYGESVITNNGKILVESDGITQLKTHDNTAVFTGTGSIVLGGTESRLTAGESAEFGNDEQHTIRGAGTVDAPIYNAGTIIAEKGTLIINQPIMTAPPQEGYGPGQVEVKTGGTLDVRAGVQTGTLAMDPEAALVVGNLKVIDLKRDFTFKQQNAAYWSWGTSSVLQMSGSGAQQQFLEVGGRDYGLSAAGFSNNFNLPALTLSSAGTYVNLADNIDNGHRSSPEALYVESLSVPGGTTLNLNRLHLYTYLQGTIHRVVAGEGDLFGGGQIIDVSVKPGPGSIPGIIFPLLLQDDYVQ